MKLASTEASVEKPRWRVAFADGVEVKIRHIKDAGAVHSHTVGIAKPRDAPDSISRAVETWHSAERGHHPVRADVRELANGVVVSVGHIKIACIVHCHARRTIKPR